ncbi:MAG: DNA repair protein RecO [Rubrivivax sp.]|nr:DNA repair protein RecO [Rubrivivax sp.]
MNATARKPPAALAAYVLHSWDWSESSLVVELLTRERGRVVVVARGAKRPTSQLRPVLVPFQRLQVALGRSPADDSAEVHLLRCADRAEGPPMPAGSALFAGFYLNELLLKLLARDDAHEALFDAYAHTLQALQAADEGGVQRALRAFELQLLRELGVLPALDTETLRVQPLDPQAGYTLHPESGVLRETSGSGVPGAALVAIEAALSAGDAPALLAAVGAAMPALRAPLRQVLHYHLGTNRLRTRQVLADVQRLIESEGPRP